MSGSAPTAVDAVRRSVELDLDVPGNTPIPGRAELSTTLDAAPADLWPLLTTHEGLASWYGPVTGDLAPEGEFQTVSGAHGRILEAESPHRLLLSWEYGPMSDRLELVLDPTDDGSSRFGLTHVSALAPEILEKFGPGATALGWDIALLGLVARTDGWRSLGIQVEPPAPAWLAGPEGAEHVRAWAIRWAAAAVAAGLDVDTARRGEIETAQAYGAPPLDHAAQG